MIANRLGIIGVGLIGGSLARALRKAGAVGEIVGAGRNPERLALAQTLGVIDRVAGDPREAASEADIVVLAAPVGQTENLLRAIQPALGPRTVVTDVGSTKANVVAAAKAVFGEVPPGFVPGHPIAGTENQGVEASFAELFQGRKVILTPLANTDPQALSVVRKMWETTGASVSQMEVAHHDEVLAATSHLPHVLAYALVDCLAAMEERREIFSYAAGGFRDFTRIASSSPEMWRDIVLANREALLPVLDGYVSDLGRLRDAIHSGDDVTIAACFERAKSARDRFIKLAGPGGTSA